MSIWYVLIFCNSRKRSHWFSQNSLKILLISVLLFLSVDYWKLTDEPYYLKIYARKRMADFATSIIIITIIFIIMIVISVSFRIMDTHIQGLIQAVFDIGIPILGTPIWACPHLILSKTKTIVKHNSRFFIRSAT